MTKKSKNKRNKLVINIKQTIVLFLAIILVAYILYKVINLVMTPTNTFLVKQDTISKEETLVGYIIREETIIKGNNYKNGIVQIKSEGEKVAEGSNIFRYYATDEDDINEKIAELNEQIQKSLEGQSDIFSSDAKLIENQIDKKLETIKGKNDINEIKEYKKDIDTYITKKAKILGDLSSSGTYINELMEKRENYKSMLTQNSETMTATVSGIVSYRVDGLESVLTPKSFENLSEQTLEELNLKTGQIVSTSSQEGKIVNNYYCYIATVTNSEESKNIKQGDKIKIRLSTQDEIYSTVEYIKEENNGKRLVVLKITNDVEYLIGYRKISFDIIWWNETGLKVPNSAIIYDGGLSYIVRNRLGYLDKILVKITNTDGNYSIVESYSSDDLKQLGFSASDINNMKNISLYDEILINPDISDL